MKIIKEILLLDNEAGVLYQGSLEEMPLRDSLVLEKCVEYFSDHDPCFIHRSAATHRVLMELEESLRPLPGLVTWDELTDKMRYILDTPGAVYALVVEWEEKFAGKSA